MYSVLLSDYVKGMELVNDFLKTKLNSNTKVVLLAWAFPTELNYNLFDNEYFKKNSDKYNKYINPLLKLGILEDNIDILNPYDSNCDFKNKIDCADVLVILGGNPEMLFDKVIHQTETLYNIKYFNKLIIGHSAGSVMQNKRYFITKENNFYDYFAYYDGFGCIEDLFYLDVHSKDDISYQDFLKNEALKRKKDIYALFDDGAIIFNRENNELNMYGKVIKYDKE